MMVPRLSGPNHPRRSEAKLANFIEPDHRGLPLFVPDAGVTCADPGAPGAPDIEILPLSLVAASGHSAGAATTPSRRA